MKSNKKLQIQHLDEKISNHGSFPDSPPRGWIYAIRTTLNMSLEQMSNYMGVTAPTLFAMEKRERNGAISLKTLKKAAAALNTRLVYGFLPIDGTFEKLLEKQAFIVAQKIVMRTDATMKLEDQQVSKERLQKSVKELAEEIKNEMPRYLWD
jgi:predicted DNA-binding mobile mystery protein A